MKDCTTEELQAELKRREAAVPSRPEPLSNPDFSALKKTVVDGVAYAVKDGYKSDDFAEYVFEAAVEAVYGPEFWKWWRSLG